MENLPLQGTDDDTTEQMKTSIDNTDQGSVSLEKPDNTTTETNSLVEHNNNNLFPSHFNNFHT